MNKKRLKKLLDAIEKTAYELGYGDGYTEGYGDGRGKEVESIYEEGIFDGIKIGRSCVLRPSKN